LSFLFNLFSGYSLLIVPAALLSIMFHEICHGYVAYRLGDPTAKAEGRLSLNPLRHIDPIGLLMLIIFRFGWARPVHVDIRYFRKPKQGMALVSLAGPLSNFLLAFISILVLCVLAYIGIQTAWIVYFFAYLTLISLGLGIFNLIPIPPLDGSKMVGALLPDRAYYNILRYERYGMLLLIAVLYLGWLDMPLAYARLYSAFYLLKGVSSIFPSGVFAQVFFQLFPDFANSAAQSSTLSVISRLL
jgi:Zn-dependent protease